jgi:hypothetical protein
MAEQGNFHSVAFSHIGEGKLMRRHDLKPALVFSLLALPMAACQTDTGAGFATGAAGGAVIGTMVEVQSGHLHSRGVLSVF